MYITKDLTPVDPRKPPYNISFTGEPNTLETRDGSLLYLVHPARVQPTEVQVWEHAGYEIFEGLAYETLNIRDKTDKEIAAELIPFAYAQISRTVQPITLTIKGYSRTFTPTDEFNSRLSNKYQTMKVANIASTRWIFDNGGADITPSDMEAIALAANNQWQPYFDTIEGVIGQIMVGTITTTEQIEDAFDAAYSEL